ncbi:Nucleoside transporter [Mycena kentingensis (nom. inval.)]|nr:Nucleoside transporter [Mycena kentingensis (nom. inval.)]
MPSAVVPKSRLTSALFKQLREGTRSPWTTNFDHIRKLPRHLRVSKSGRWDSFDPSKKDDTHIPKERVKFWNIVPGDKVRVRGRYGNKLRDVWKIRKLENIVEFSLPENATRPEHPAYSYASCQLYIGEYEFPPLPGSTEPRKLPVFANRISTSTPVWNGRKFRWQWDRFATSTTPTVPGHKQGDKILIPWPRVKRATQAPGMSSFSVLFAFAEGSIAGLYDTKKSDVYKVTYVPPAFLSKLTAPLPRVPTEAEYIAGMSHPTKVAWFGDSPPVEPYLAVELSNPHSRTKKMRRWQSHKLYRKELLRDYIAAEMRELNGRTTKDARAEATFRWKQKLSAEDEAERRRRWLTLAVAEKSKKKRARKTRREQRRLDALTRLTLPPTTTTTTMSSDALYHPIPQAPVADHPTQLPEDDEPLPPQPITPSIKWIHFILGCAVLLPWNVVITAMPFFFARLGDSPLRLAFGSWLACSFTLSNFLWLGLATVTSKQSSPARRALVTILLLSVLTFTLVLSTFVHTTPSIFFAFVLLNGIAQGGLGAYLQTAIIVIASLFGPSAVQALMSGQAGVAVAVSGVQVFTAAASTWSRPKEEVLTARGSDEPEESSAFVFFTLSTVFLVVAAAAQGWLVTMPAYKTIAASLERQKRSTAGETSGLVSTGRSDGKAQIIRVAKANALLEFAVAYIFIITLAVYPAITTSIQPVNPSTHPLLFSAVHFFVFNCGDFAGRSLCSIPRLRIWSPKHLLTLSLARTLFIPLFLACNLQRPGGVESKAPLISSDLLFMLILLVFGASNGYVSSLCMMAAPSLEHNPRLKGRMADVDVAATVASFCLVGGLMVGSLCSFGVRAIICGCNPFTESS